MLTANRRLAEYIRHNYDQQQLKNNLRIWPSLKVMPLNTWQLALWNSSANNTEKILSDFQEYYLWKKIIQQTQKTSLPLLQVDQTAEQVGQAWRLLHAWQISIPSLKKITHTQETHAFINWSLQFIELCQQHGWRSQAEIAQRLQPSSNLPAQIYIIGFDVFTPADLQFIESLRKYTEVKIICNDQPSEVHTEENFSYATHLYVDVESEINAMAQWAKSYLQINPHHTLGCIIPQLGQYRQRIAHVFQQIFAIENQLPGATPIALKYHISAGQTLQTFSMISIALHVLALGGGQLSTEKCSEWLQSHYLCQNETDVNLGAMIDIELRLTNCFELPVTALFAAINRCQAYFPHHTWLHRWREFLKQLNDSSKSQLPSLWAKDFVQQLQAIGWPGGRALNSLEHQLLNRWQDLLAEFMELDLVTGAITHDTAYQLLHKLTSQTIFQPQISSTLPIQILGTLESNGFEFDAVWIMGLDDQNWPPQPQHNPFIPLHLSMQKQIRLLYTEKITPRLLRSAKRIWLSCSPFQLSTVSMAPCFYPPLGKANARNEGGAPHSSLSTARNAVCFYPPLGKANARNEGGALRAAPPCDPPWRKESSLWELYDHDYAWIIFQSSNMQSCGDYIGPPVALDEKIYGGSAILTKQAECPFRGFANYRLNAMPLPELTLGINPIERGTLLHSALEKIWQVLQNQKTLQSMAEIDLLHLINSIVDNVINDFSSSYKQESVFLSIERERTINLINDWLNIEKIRPPFTLVAQETQLSIDLSGLKLQLKIDRIDRLGDGSLMLIDYKTGLTHLKNWFGDRPQQPQLPLYAVYSWENQEFSAIAFAQLRAGQLTFNGLHVESADSELFPQGLKSIDAYKDFEAPKNWQDLLFHWRQVLTKLATEFTSGYARIDPAEQGLPCQTCELQTLCRINNVSSSHMSPVIPRLDRGIHTDLQACLDPAIKSRDDRNEKSND